MDVVPLEKKGVILAKANLLQLFVIFFLIMKIMNLSQKLKSEEKMYEISRKYAVSLCEKLNEMNTFRHDIKKTYMLEIMYLDSGELEKLKKHYSKITDMKMFEKSDTGNSFIDMLTNNIKDYSNSQNVNCEFDVRIPVEMKFDEYRMTRLLINITDNAIEAAAKCDVKSRWIRFAVKIHGNNMYISCSNSCVNTKNLKIGYGRQSSKKDMKLHGFGIKIIKEIVHSYNGSIEMEQLKEIFELRIVLYNVEENLK